MFDLKQQCTDNEHTILKIHNEKHGAKHSRIGLKIEKWCSREKKYFGGVRLQTN